MTTSHHTRRGDGSSYRDGDETAKGWKSRKYYLSDEAIALLVEHCNGTPLTMSAYLDGLIKRELYHAPYDPADRSHREPLAEVRKVLDEGAKQVADLTAPTMTTQDGTVLPAMKHANTKAGELNDAELDQHIRNLREDHKKQSAKKDFDLDV